jgi:nitroreductase
MSNASSIFDLIETRNSVTRYDASRGVSDETLTELVRLATLAPSAYHLQNWKFIAVRTPAAKARLMAAAFDQPQVADAAATFIVVGRLAAHEQLPQALRPALERGVMPADVVERWVAAAKEAHPGDPQLQRDEALRSASLAAMTLMLAAQGMGLATGAVGGFDAARVAQEFGLEAQDVPVMLVTLGHAREGNWPQKPRKPLQEVLAFA